MTAAPSRASPVRPVDAELAALRAIAQVAAYDSLRVETYAPHLPATDHGRTARIGQHRALRFSQVGYFNRVYLLGPVSRPEWAAIEAFFAGAEHPVEVVGLPQHSEPALCAAAAEGRGLAQPGALAWLHQAVDSTPSTETPTLSFGGLSLRPPRHDEIDRCCELYLEAFGAPVSGWHRAVANLRRLFTRPELSFWLACEGERLAGLSMVFRQGESGLLSAGAVRDAWRGRRLHRVLIDHRLQHARQAGWQHAYSWAASGGSSHRNLLAAGFEEVACTPVWKLSPLPRSTAIEHHLHELGQSA